MPTISDKKKPSKPQMRATAILGMIVSYIPDVLNDRDCKHIAESLELVLKEDRGPYRVAAAEILGRGFNVWAPHINGASILRSLIALTGLSNIKPDQETPKDQRPWSLLMQSARQAVVYIATTNAPLFISTITLDLSHSKLASERTIQLKLLGMFTSKVRLGFKH